MSLEEGHLLGRYRVEAFLAQGGMGRIYSAFDTLLGRRVALKVLADSDRSGSPAIARLLREARAAAALSHPNICSVFDVGEIDGQPFIAMELVQGTSLRLLLADRETGLEQRLRWVHDLACALAAAHKAGIVHRDIKPDNAMVARDGRVRLLDFGVAKWDDPRGELGDGPALAGAFRTQEGQVIGTTGYMAPEQAEGGHVDARTDQFAWGVLAHETISGRHPFGDRGFGDPPLLSSVAPALPFGVAAVVAKALALDPAQRFADMDEIVAVLQPLVGAPAPLPAPPDGSGAQLAPGVLPDSEVPPTRPGSSDPRAETTRVLERRPGSPSTADGSEGPRARRWPRRAAVGIAALAVAAAGAAIAVRRSSAPERPAGPIGLQISNVRRVTFGDRCEEFPSFFPDGRALVYDGDDGTGNYVLYRLDLEPGASPRVIVPQTDPGWDMAGNVSPDGERVVFVHRGKQYTGAMVARIDGKEPPRTLGVATMYPRFSRDGRAVWAGKFTTAALFDLATGDALRTLALPSATRPLGVLEGDDGAVIAQVTTGANGGPAGLALFTTDGSVRWQIREEVVPGLAWAPGRRHVIASRVAIAGGAEMIAVPLDGSPVVSLAHTGIAPRDGIDVSPDGTHIAWSTCAQTPRVSVIDPAGREAETLIKEAADVDAIARMPGGRDLLVISTRTGRQRLWMMDSLDERAPREIDTADRTTREVAVSPDGKRFAVTVPGAGVGVGSLVGDSAFRMVTDQPGDDGPSFRRDGEAVAFTRHRADGVTQVMIVPFGGGAESALLAPDTHHAALSPVDDTVVYLVGINDAPMIVGPGGAAARPLSPALSGPDYAGLRFSPDGTRLLLLRANQELIEIDIARGAVVRSVATAPGEAFYFPFYAASGPAVIRVRWQGSIYVADAAWSLGAGAH